MDYSLVTIQGFLMEYEIYENKLSCRYTLPNRLRLDYWGYDVSKENYGIVITDTMGSSVLHMVRSLRGESIISKLYGYDLENGSFIVTVILDSRDSVNVSINENLSLTILGDFSLTKVSNYVDLNNKEVISWLEYKNSYHPYFFMLSVIFAISIIFNVFIMKGIHGWVKEM